MILGTPHFRLPFGNQDAIIDNSFNRVCEKIEQAVPGNFDAEITTNAHKFLQASSQVSFANLTLTALAVTPIRVNRKSETQPTLVIPFSGNVQSKVDGKIYTAHAGSSALFSSGRPRDGVLNNHLSEILITLDHNDLLRVAQVMLGPDQEFPVDALCIDQDREVALKIGNTSFDALFRNLCRTLDGLHLNPQALAMLAVGDVFYRSIVTLLAPALFFGDSKREIGSKSKETEALELVCDYIKLHIERPITFTELEKISGLSARSLQYAFRRRFDCSPMDWVRQHRLALTRSSLSSGVKGTTVTQVALQFGFSNLSLFARHYRQRFGESPSATLQRALGTQ